jgi:hypothetical protein
MSDETKHTPTPWRWENKAGVGIQILANIPTPTPCVEYTLAADEQVIFVEPWIQFKLAQWEEMQTANAEFIVTACNSHDDLLAACESLVTACDTAPPVELMKHISMACEQARAAITKAEGRSK